MFSIEILRKYLLEYTRAAQKSLDAVGNRTIPVSLHNAHMKNLQPKIDDLKRAIKILEES